MDWILLINLCVKVYQINFYMKFKYFKYIFDDFSILLHLRVVQVLKSNQSNIQDGVFNSTMV